MIKVTEAVQTIKKSYPGLEKNNLVSAIADMAQYSIKFFNPGAAKPREIHLVLQYNRAKFHLPYGDDILDTGDMAELEHKVKELAEKGYVIAEQAILFGMTHKDVIHPAKEG